VGGGGMGLKAESIERFVEDQAFSPSCDLAPSPTPSPHVSKLSLFLSSCVSPVELIDGRKRGEGLGEEPNQIIRRRESLVLFKSFNTLWVKGKEGRIAVYLEKYLKSPLL
jgi:hypothetical protein